MFSGAFSALVTPMRGGTVDEESFREFVEWQIEQGINGLVPCGTTGESGTLSHDEHKLIIRACVEQAKGRVPVIAGAGSNSTSEAIELTRVVKDIGADAALHITPYYNKPTQEGMYQHFKAIAAEVSLPVIAYNVPGRTGVNLLPETLARISRDIPEVIGVKEATASLGQISNVIEYCGPDFLVLSGDDFTVLPILAIGGHGVISVTSNVVPSKMAGLCKAFSQGNLAEARRLHYEIEPINRAMFLETNPGPVKAALALMKKMEPDFRLPMVPLQPENQKRLESTLVAAGLI